MRRNRRFGILALIAAAGLLWLNMRGCSGEKTKPDSRDPNLVLVTGYCNCGKCCNWRRTWFGFGPAVYKYGSMKGRRKQVGITASGTTARRGTIAADPQVFRFGTRLEVPGYGVGTVEDVGGAIKGRHVDVWFPSHAAAVKWGRKWLKIKKVK